MTFRTIAPALLPLALLAACAAPPPPAPPAVAPPPEEAFRPVCEQRWQTPFAVARCMFDELDRSRGVTPASVQPDAPTPATPAPAPAPARRAR